MMSETFQSEQIDVIRALNEYSLSKSLYEGGGAHVAKQNCLYGGKESPEADFESLYCGMDSFNAHSSTAKSSNSISAYQIDQFAEFGSLDELCLDSLSTSLQSDDDINKHVSVKPQNLDLRETKRKFMFPSSSLEILQTYGSQRRRLSSEAAYRPNHERRSASSDCPTLSTEMIIQLAAEKFIQSTCQHRDEISFHSHPYPTPVLAYSEDSSEVQLVQTLLYCADKIGRKQYERARKFLEECARISSVKGNTVQRLAFYFTEALYERVERETGQFTQKGSCKKGADNLGVPEISKMTEITFHKELPLSQINKFAAMQAIVEHVAEASKIHMIDLEIRNGIHCTILMQALMAQRANPVQSLKITAISTKSKGKIEETGQRLASFAQSLNFLFSFNVVMVKDFQDLNENMIEIDAEESIAVYAEYILMFMIARPAQLENLMRVIRIMNPCVMVIAEAETTCNSPVFVDRFVEALFFYGAFFDSVTECLKNDEEHRMSAESTCFGPAIKNMIAAEGEDRKTRHVSIRVWRAFFARFGLAEEELSMSSVYQANLVLKNFHCGNSFTLDMDGKCLIVRWKGTPLGSLSAWKFDKRS